MKLRTPNHRFTALALTLASALVVLGSSADVTARAPSPGAQVAQSQSASAAAAASLGGGRNSIALLAGEAGTTLAQHPGADATPANIQGSNIQGSAGTMQDFLVYVITDVDAYWTDVFKEEGKPEPQVTYAFPAAGESVATLCGPTDDLTAFYCTVDDQIVVSQNLAKHVWDGTIAANEDNNTDHKTGDFSVAYVVAHEFAHSLQAELGFLEPDVLVYPTVNTELHADCWAGVWANEAEFQGILDHGDIEEAVQTATDLGDYAVDDPTHHGTPAQRSEAFLTGYDGGAPEECAPYLTGTY